MLIGYCPRVPGMDMDPSSRFRSRRQVRAELFANQQLADATNL